MEPVGGMRCELEQEQGRAHDADAQEGPEGELALLGCASVAAGYEGCASLLAPDAAPPEPSAATPVGTTSCT